MRLSRQIAVVGIALLVGGTWVACGKASESKKAPVEAPEKGQQVSDEAPVKPPPGQQGAPAPGNLGQKPPEFQGKRVAVVHTANLIGELEPCG